MEGNPDALRILRVGLLQRLVAGRVHALPQRSGGSASDISSRSNVSSPFSNLSAGPPLRNLPHVGLGDVVVRPIPLGFADDGFEGTARFRLFFWGGSLNPLNSVHRFVVVSVPPPC